MLFNDCIIIDSNVMLSIRVRTLKENKLIKWRHKKSRENCMWGVEGKIVKIQNPDVRCFLIEHQGKIAWYGDDEFEIITSKTRYEMIQK